LDFAVEKRNETYSFTGAASKGEGSTGRVSKRTAIINNPGVEDIGGDNILQMLHEMNSPVAVLQFGDKYYTM
jgi:hypothetical protein